MQNSQNKTGLYLSVQPLSTEKPVDVTRLLAVLKHRLPTHPENTQYLQNIADSTAPLRVKVQRLSALLTLTELLSQVLPDSLDTLHLWRDENGRPYAQTGASCPPFDFNLSHTEGMVACALLVGNGRVGVDAEALLPYDRAHKLAKRFYTERENTHLSTFSTEYAYAEEVTRLWTAKEAISKQDGHGEPLRFDGLNIPDGSNLQSFRYAHPNGSAIFVSLCASVKAVTPIIIFPTEGFEPTKF